MKYKLKIVEAVVIGGRVKVPGTIVEVENAVAVDLLRRGRAVNAEPAKPVVPEESETVDLAGMSKAQLLAFAKDNDLDVPTTGTKAEIIDAIVAATE